MVDEIASVFLNVTEAICGIAISDLGLVDHVIGDAVAEAAATVAGGGWDQGASGEVKGSQDGIGAVADTLTGLRASLGESTWATSGSGWAGSHVGGTDTG